MVSVIVLTYNNQSTIRETLLGLFCQDQSLICQVIISDDCSCDNTVAVIREVIKDSIISEKVVLRINNENKGVVRNFWAATKSCNEEIIMICAGDDYWLPHKVKTQVTYLLKNTMVEMCYSRAKIISDIPNKLHRKYTGTNKHNFKMLLLNNCIPAVTVAFRKNSFLNYDSEIAPLSRDWNMEDYPFWLWLSYNKKIGFINDTLAVYRQSIGSISNPQELKKSLSFYQNVHGIRLFFAIRYGFKNYVGKINKIYINNKLRLYIRKKHLFEYKNLMFSSKKLIFFSPISRIIDLVYFLLG